VAKHRGWTVLQRGSVPVGYKARHQAHNAARSLNDAWVEGPLAGALKALLGWLRPKAGGR
jgi:hypothetical protein